LIQIFLDTRIIIGAKTTNVPIMDRKVILILDLSTKKLITKAAKAKAIPTP